MEYPFYPGTNVYFGRAEAAMALRQRLNETVDQLDALKKEHTELEVKLEERTKALTVARSDCAFIWLFFAQSTEGSAPSQ